MSDSLLTLSVLPAEDFVVSVVAHAADVDSETELYTLEDGLDLWLCLARNLPHASPSLLALFPLLLKTLARDFEHLQVCMHIVESMLLLSGAELVEAHGSALSHMLLNVLGNVKESGTLMAIEVLDLLLTVQPQRGVALLEGSGVLYKVLAMMLDADEQFLVRAACVALLSRVATWDASFFIALLERAAAAGVGGGGGAGGGGQGTEGMGSGAQEGLRHRFVDECIARADNLMLPRKRRLVALGERERGEERE